MLNGTLAAGTLKLADFTSYNAMAQSNGLIGAGSDKTFLVVSGPIKAPKPTTPTNPYYALMGGSPSNPLKSPIFRGFTILAVGTWPYAFGGLRVTAINPLIEDVKIVAVPGTANTPPGETFGMNLWRCQGARVRDCEVDGEKVGAAGFGTNTSIDTEYRDCYAHDLAASHGFTAWESDLVTHVDCRAENNGTQSGSMAGVGFNHEESTRIAHLRSDSVGNSMGSMRFLNTSGSQKVLVAASYLRGPIVVAAKQLLADVDCGSSLVF